MAFWRENGHERSGRILPAPFPCARRRTCEVAVLVGALAVLWFAPDFAGDYWLQLGFRIFIYLTLAEGWNLMAGRRGWSRWARPVSSGSAPMSRSACSIVSALPLPLALLVCAIAGGRIGSFGVAGAVPPARPLFHGRHACARGTAAAVDGQVSTFGGASGIFLQEDPPALPVLFRYALVVALIASLAMTLCARTRVSVILRAVRDDEDAAAQMGVRPFRVKLGAFVLASALAAMAGGMQAVKLGAIEPYGMFGLQWSIDVLSMVIIGGVGMRLGPVVGALFVVALGEMLADYPELHIAITGVILIVLIRFAPHGVVGLAAKLPLSRRMPA